MGSSGVRERLSGCIVGCGLDYNIQSVACRTQGALCHRETLPACGQVDTRALENDDLDECIAAASGLLQDDAYGGRCAAARLVPQLCAHFPNHQARAARPRSLATQRCQVHIDLSIQLVPTGQTERRCAPRSSEVRQCQQIELGTG